MKIFCSADNNYRIKLRKLHLVSNSLYLVAPCTGLSLQVLPQVSVIDLYTDTSLRVYSQPGPFGVDGKRQTLSGFGNRKQTVHTHTGTTEELASDCRACVTRPGHATTRTVLSPRSPVYYSREQNLGPECGEIPRALLDLSLCLLISDSQCLHGLTDYCLSRTLSAASG
ncbi:hypothetical protein RRG08_038206 [Elysia crispata]|uniref:Uncharacterized protein n=1 Tax=Elysia crispata TaxID=231223 RepID=A0AAE1AMM7_9GAST|nr:hypothetical protein RRG08_038206 [Elysia crispata]